MAHSYLIEELTKTTGKFDPKKQYAFTNWTDRDFTFKWGGEENTIKAGEIAVYPQYLAYHACKHFVNDIMIRAGKEVQIMNPVLRKEYEDKTLKELAAGAENPYVASIREQEREKLMKEFGMGGADVGVTTSESIREAMEAAKEATANIAAVDAAAAEKKAKQLESLAKGRETAAKNRADKAAEYSKANRE